MPLTTPRTHYRPYEYPRFLRYRDAIRHSYWVHTEFSYTSDLQDYALVDETERALVRRALVAIAQVELAVKLFWARLYDLFPKPEVAEVGVTFAESEVRHANAYAHLLQLLDLEDLFARSLPEDTALTQRQAKLHAVLSHRKSDLADQAMGILLFSAFTEHISLFSQFYVLMGLNRRGNRFKGISNAIEATSKEENVHGLFGAELLRTLQQENPQLFGSGFEDRARALARELLQSEVALLDWLFADGEPALLTRDETLEFLKHRYNQVLALHGLPDSIPVNLARIPDVTWFELELLSDKEVDFFNKRSVAYARRTRSFNPDELF
ncbi:MAG: ribonucleotide-diphosphate reductase subunit beta [Armatimonadota bacterium]|nr:ribonucleotide-diphosphate reductase subunit beta [Armatimonadota bacterium]